MVIVNCMPDAPVDPVAAPAKAPAPALQEVEPMGKTSQQESATSMAFASLDDAFRY